MLTRPDALPIFGGWIADTRWGRFKTICIGVAICGKLDLIRVDKPYTDHAVLQVSPT